MILIQPFSPAEQWIRSGSGSEGMLSIVTFWCQQSQVFLQHSEGRPGTQQVQLLIYLGSKNDSHSI